MAGADVSVDVKEVKGLADVLNKVSLSPKDRTSLLGNIGQDLERQTQDRFDEQESPDGKPWKAIAQKTLDYYTEKGFAQGSILIMSGGLRDSIESQVPDSWQVLIGATKEYAAIHQFGGEIKPKTKKHLFVPGYGYLGKVTIPARPYLGISDENAREIVNAVHTFIAGRFQS